MDRTRRRGERLMNDPQTVDVLLEDLTAVRAKRDEYRAEADRLRDLIAEHHTAVSLDIPCENANRRLWREALDTEEST